MAAQPLQVPVMWLQELWDQEDLWGAIHCYEAVEPKDAANDKNYLVMGPWPFESHPGWAARGCLFLPLPPRFDRCRLHAPLHFLREEQTRCGR